MRRSRVRWPLISLCGAFVWLLIMLSPFVELRAATEERVFVDSSRPTRENGSFPGAPDRTLRTLIWVPSGPCGGPESCPPFPLFLMAHGFGGLPEKFEAFASTIAEAGYVVASPAFPLTNADAPGGHLTGFTDYVNQPEDLAFVAGELFLANSSMADSLFGLIDPNTTAVLGHSLGGASVQALAHSDCCQLLPLRAAVLVDTFAGLVPGNPIQTGPTTLVLHGTEDPTIPFASAFDLLATLPTPRYLVGIDGAGHSEQLESQVEPPIPARAAAQLATTAFLNAELRGEDSEFEAALASLVQDGHVVVADQVQEKDQQKCINALNKNFAKVAKAQGKDICDCIKDFAKGRSLTPAGTVEECLIADRKGKVAKAKGKTKSDATKNCSAMAPDFGATDPNTVNKAAAQKELDLIHDIFGSDLNVVIAPEAIAIDKPRSKCQQAVAKVVKKCQDANLKEFNNCKKSGLKSQSIQSFIDLQDCMGQDPKGKIAKACDPTTGKIRSTIDKKCGSVDFPGAFPQVVAIPGCGTDDPATLATCLDQIVECQVCLALNQADGLSRDCDDFDDDVVNGSCP